MQITPSAKAVLEKRYLMRDAEGRPIETVEDMFAGLPTPSPRPTQPTAAMFPAPPRSFIR